MRRMAALSVVLSVLAFATACGSIATPTPLAPGGTPPATPVSSRTTFTVEPLRTHTVTLTSPWEAGRVVAGVRSNVPVSFAVQDPLGREVVAHRNTTAIDFSFRASSFGEYHIVFDNTRGASAARVELSYGITPS